MAKVVIIGGAGHVGTHLLPRLVALGHHVVNISRGLIPHYAAHPAWSEVEKVALDRTAAEAAGEFGPRVAALKPDVVIDMICFTPDSAIHLADVLAGRIGHLIHIGTIWVHGHSVTVPTRESDARTPFGDYGVQKSQIEDLLLERSRLGNLPTTVIRPGHIVGPGWAPLNPAGHFNTQVFRDIRDGKRLVLPNFGMETVHHVHADDVAQAVELAAQNPEIAAGEAFNAVSPAAVTLRGYAEAMFRWFGCEPNLSFLPFEKWKAGANAEDAQATWEHISRSPCHSIEKATRLLTYRPQYSSMAAVQESVAALLPSI